jgi:hypothetical protein
MDQNEPKTKQAERGRETLFRVSYQHQSKLIQIADYKANMNISLSTMIISGIIAITGYGAVAGKIDDFSSTLFIPVAGIMLSCLVSLVFAIQAARPKLIMNMNTTDPSQKSSLLFFGVIASYTQPAYLEKMKTLLTSENELYEHMTIDLYNQGKILKRKYNLLLYSYQVLMYGFVINVILFLALLIAGPIV